MEKRVGIRELKAQLSSCIRAVKEGHTLVITERGRAVGRMTPVGQSPEERIDSLVRSGVVSWNGKKLKASRPTARVRAGRKTLAEIVSEDRD